MLKLEKKRNHRTVTVSIISREQRFNATFLKALIYAVVFHLTAFLLFNIHLWKQSHAGFLPFTAVDILKDASLVQMEQGKRTIRYPLFLPYSQPTISSLSIKELTPSPTYQPSTAISRTYQPVRWRLSGGLINHEWQNPFPSMYVQTTHSLQEYALSYAVQVDDRTGKIFWFIQQQSSGNLEIDRLGEVMLREITFKKGLQNMITTGTIDLMIIKED